MDAQPHNDRYHRFGLKLSDWMAMSHGKITGNMQEKWLGLESHANHPFRDRNLYAAVPSENT